MPKVRMLIKVSGSRDGVDWPEIGETLDVSQAEAEQMYLNRQAAPASDKEAKLETADAANGDVEVAVTKRVKATPAKDPERAIHDAPKPAAQIGDVKPGLTTDAVK